jgi:phosphodiesterase/alkaline phosphatase D-like protein
MNYTPNILLTSISSLIFATIAVHADLPLGVAAGDTTQTSSVLWGKANAAGAVTFDVATDASFTNIFGSHSVPVLDAAIPAKWDVSGLAAGTQYYYRASDDGGATFSPGLFRTFENVGVGAGVHFGVSGDWRGELGSYPAVANVAGRNLDFFAVLGDTIYGDVASSASAGFTNPNQAQTLAEYRAKHAEVYGPGLTGTSTLKALRASTSVFATIDDHEVTNDFAGGALISSDARFTGTPTDRINDSALFSNGLQVFQEYNPVRDLSYGTVGGDGRMDGEKKLYRAQQFGSKAAMFMLDARSFRDQEVAPGAAMFSPARTMLGSQQLADLKNDLLAAQSSGVTWKFVMVPEPIQQLGALGSSDRFEGYYSERNNLLAFIDSNDIQNVVFVSADIHGTVLNDLSYSSNGLPSGTQIPTGAFEITTGSVAYDKPFTPTVIDLAEAAGLITPATAAFLRSLPPAVQDAQIANLINSAISPDPLFGALDPLGLELGEGIDFTMLQGPANGFVGTTFGWTEFDIATDGLLTVTTWGIPAYDLAALQSDPAAIAALTPTIRSQFTVAPVPEPTSASLLLAGLCGWLGLRRRRV